MTFGESRSGEGGHFLFEHFHCRFFYFLRSLFEEKNVKNMNVNLFSKVCNIFSENEGGGHPLKVEASPRMQMHTILC